MTFTKMENGMMNITATLDELAADYQVTSIHELIADEAKAKIFCEKTVSLAQEHGFTSELGMQICMAIKDNNLVMTLIPFGTVGNLNKALGGGSAAGLEQLDLFNKMIAAKTKKEPAFKGQNYKIYTGTLDDIMDVAKLVNIGDIDSKLYKYKSEYYIIFDKYPKIAILDEFLKGVKKDKQANIEENGEIILDNAFKKLAC